VISVPYGTRKKASFTGSAVFESDNLHLFSFAKLHNFSIIYYLLFVFYG
jgi:hypothetical protein